MRSFKAGEGMRFEESSSQKIKENEVGEMSRTGFRTPVLLAGIVQVAHYR